jgi:hypothetical protein
MRSPGYFVVVPPAGEPVVLPPEVEPVVEPVPPVEPVDPVEPVEPVEPGEPVVPELPLVEPGMEAEPEAEPEALPVVPADEVSEDEVAGGVVLLVVELGEVVELEVEPVPELPLVPRSRLQPVAAAEARTRMATTGMRRFMTSPVQSKVRETGLCSLRCVV